MVATATRCPRYLQTLLWRDSSRFLGGLETAVRAFPRYHRYTLGGDLRRQLMHVCHFIACAGQSRMGTERGRQREPLFCQLPLGVYLHWSVRRRSPSFCQIVEAEYLRGGMKHRSRRWTCTPPPGSGSPAGTTAASPSIFPFIVSSRGES